MKVHYKTKTADEQELCAHLIKCKNNFNPPLDKTVNIKEYSIKLFDRSVTFEAWVNQSLAGVVAAYFNDYENKLGFISNVSVCREFLGNGIASELIKNCINYGRENKFREISLKVYKNNASAIYLYDKFNFKITSNCGEHYEMKHILNDV